MIKSMFIFYYNYIRVGYNPIIKNVSLFFPGFSVHRQSLVTATAQLTGDDISFFPGSGSGSHLIVGWRDLYQGFIVSDFWLQQGNCPISSKQSG